ncbi:MAG: AMIN domain-containing protein [candidate division Zixibacteria bacterium]|nr:AMIN domain-containing protein [candidate division Zixibacteria bacterium]
MRINYRTKLSVVILTFLFGWMLSVSADSARGSCRIENISLEKEGNFTKVCIYADKPFEFIHSTEEAKEGKPYRVIIDCKDAIFGLPQHNFKKGLPPGMIEAIRTSQFQAMPERIVRVVLDLKGPVVYKVIDTGTEKKASIAIMTNQDQDFPIWMAVKEETKDQKMAMGKRQTKVASAEAIPKKELKSEQAQTSPSGVEGSPELTVAEKEKAEPVQKQRIYRKAVSYADTGESVLSVEEKPVVLFEPQSEVEDTRMEERVSPVIEQQPALPLPKFSPRIEEEKTPKDVSSASAKLALKSTAQTKVEKKKAPTVSQSSFKPSLSKPHSPRRRISRSPVPLGPFPEDRSSLTEVTEKAKETKAIAEKREGVPTEVSGSMQKGIGKILGPEPVAARETKTLAESLMIIQTPQESELSLVPQRKLVYYNPGIRRDPFLPLTERQDMSFGEAPLPLFDNLKLVGILKDEEGNQALLEDEVGFGYILKSGDRIKNGYVIRVEDNRAVFRVEEYGGYQIMVLELNREY